MPIQAVRIIKFDAGHRVVNHESKCRTLHGHEYKAEIFAQGDLDNLGRVVDFSVIKDKVGKWIDEFFDHTMVIWEKDPNLIHLLKCDGAKNITVVRYNPTAENIASHILEVSNVLLKSTGVKVVKIKLWETSNCYVEVSDV